jgi:5,10-methylenetetrahydrofolate reductase
MDTCPDKKRECIQIAVEIIQAVKPYCQGIHLMAIGWEELIPDIYAAARLHR